jgi:tRNA A58 N-methylase Trm61
MDHRDHVDLLREGVFVDGQSPTGTWADLGSGEGAFTLALAELLDPQAEIYSLDSNPLFYAASNKPLRRVIHSGRCTLYGVTLRPPCSFPGWMAW